MVPTAPPSLDDPIMQPASIMLRRAAAVRTLALSQPWQPVSRVGVAASSTSRLAPALTSTHRRSFAGSSTRLASQSDIPPQDPQNDPGNILRRLAESPTAMASITKLMTVIKEEGGIDIGQGIRPDGSMDPDAMAKRPSMFQMARMMMNSNIRDAVKEVHAELLKAGIELTPERVQAILQADDLIRGLKK
ncbi:hypothetical protein OC834_001858 [Tilletia horrida]|nr:hypothetical protein OC834_001858 [Tilletia horrida]